VRLKFRLCAAALRFASRISPEKNRSECLKLNAPDGVSFSGDSSPKPQPHTANTFEKVTSPTLLMNPVSLFSVLARSCVCCRFHAAVTCARYLIGIFTTFAAPAFVSAQTGVVAYSFTTFAGQASVGNTDGTGIAARFNSPNGIAIDGAGNLYIADTYNHVVRRITPSGAVTTLAGSGRQGTADGTGAASEFSAPH
jgi:hypothetical protein